MSLTTVHCTPNPQTFTATVTNADDGKQYRLKIEPCRALIDNDGYVRFFIITYSDGESHGYLLHPYKHALIRGQQEISWIAAFLGGFGLSKVRGAIVKLSTEFKTANPLAALAIDLGAYFLFSSTGGYVVKTYADSLLLDSKFGYHNIQTDRLIFTPPIRMSTY